MNLLDALSGIGTVLDTPGAMLRTGLAGENPFAAVFDTDKRVSGRDLLERYGLADENEDQGWIPDLGDLGGFAAEILLDPTNLLGGAGLAKRLMGISKAKKANQTINAVIEGNRGAQKTNFAQEMADGLRSESDDLSRMRDYQGHSNAPKTYINAETGKKFTENVPMVDISQISPIDEEVFSRWPANLTADQKRRFLTGTRDDAAQIFADAHGYMISEPHELAKKLGEGGEFNVYGYNAPLEENGRVLPELLGADRRISVPLGLAGSNNSIKQTLGFVPTQRGDLVFSSTGKTHLNDAYGHISQAPHSLPLQAGIVSHESMHSLARQRPEEFAKFQEMLGKPANPAIIDVSFETLPSLTNRQAIELTNKRLADMRANDIASKEFEKIGPRLTDAAYERRYGPDWPFAILANLTGSNEEGLATAIGDSVRHGASRQRFPTVDAMFVNSPRELNVNPGLVEELSSLIGLHYPKAHIKDSNKASRILLDYLQGNYKKRNALVPSGKVVDESFPRSFFQGELPVEPRRPMEAGPASMMAVPERRRVASMVPLLTALLGHNAMARPKYGGGAE